MYNVAWHERHGEGTAYSAETIIGIVRSFLAMESVLDLGCGDGRWLSVCRDMGAGDILGLDGDWTDRSRLRIPANAFAVQDLSLQFDLHRRFSLAISLEVAEHVAARHAGVFVDNLVRHSDVVLFGAAIPYQGGFRHINEQWQSYWAALFAARGFAAYDPLRGQIWNDGKVEFWYKQNMLLYVNRSDSATIGRVARYIDEGKISQLPFDVIHPDKYSATASYRAIAFKPLVRELPQQVIKKLSRLMTSGA